MYLIPLLVQVVDDRIGFVHELFSFVKGRREKAEGGAVPVPRDDGFSVVIHDDFEMLVAFQLKLLCRADSGFVIVNVTM